MGLVAFDLQEIIPPFFGDGPGDLALAVQCVGGVSVTVRKPMKPAGLKTVFLRV